MNDDLIALLKQRMDDPDVRSRLPQPERRRVRDVIRKMISGTIRSPRADTLKKIADELDLDEARLLALTGGVGNPSEVRRANVPPPIPSAAPEDVPVLGTAAGSVAGAFRLDSGPVNYVRRPPGLTGARGIYAVYVEADSMAPLHQPGDLRFVDPHRPPAIGDSVIIQIKARENAETEAYIKKLVRRNGSSVVTEQFNPPATVKFKTDHVVAMHKVLTVNELFGV